jgi:hypothetical protein
MMIVDNIKQVREALADQEMTQDKKGSTKSMGSTCFPNPVIHSGPPVE